MKHVPSESRLYLLSSVLLHGYFSFITHGTCHIFPGAAEISNLGLWGNYSIPKDNPFTEDEELLPEIWAMGLRNPWRCSFDSERPSYFMCADTGQVSDHSLLIFFFIG